MHSPGGSKGAKPPRKQGWRTQAPAKCPTGLLLAIHPYGWMSGPTPRWTPVGILRRLCGWITAARRVVVAAAGGSIRASTTQRSWRFALVRSGSGRSEERRVGEERRSRGVGGAGKERKGGQHEARGGGGRGETRPRER